MNASDFLYEKYGIAVTEHNKLPVAIKPMDLLKYMEEYAALRQQPVSGELNCEHDWLVDMYDHFGFPASRFCDKCNTREAI